MFWPLHPAQMTLDDWKVLDGTPLAPGECDPTLFGYLTRVYGTDGKGNVNTPQVVGRFPRGVDTTGTVDKGLKNRTSPITGKAPPPSDPVGSLQDGSVGPHEHAYDAWFETGDVSDAGKDLHSHGGFQYRRPQSAANDGLETRPVNICFYYIMYVGRPKEETP